MKTKNNKLHFITACIMLVVSAFINVYMAFLLQKIIDATSSNRTSSLIKPIIFALVFMVIDIVISLISKYLCTLYIQRTLENMKNNRFKYILSKKDNLDNSELKKALSNFNTDIDIVERDYLQEKFNIVFYSAQFLIALIAIISISWEITLTVGIISLILLIIPNFTQKKVQDLQDTYSDSTSSYTLFVGESLNAKQDIIGYNVLNSLMDKHKILNNLVESKRKKIRFASSAIGVICSNLGFLSFVSALGIGAYMVIKGNMTFGYMIAAIQLMNNLMNPLNYLLSILVCFKSSKNIVGKFDEKNEESKEFRGKEFNFNNKIQITDLCFYYDTNKPVINNINLEIRKGQKIALVGPSGSGKSTIAKILAREITDYTGLIKIDNVPIQELDLISYRNNIRYIRQNAPIFTDTVLNNIVFFQTNYTNKNLENALHLSRTDQFISNQDDANRVIDSTTGLSGGQLQRLIIARALLCTSQLLILDEFTSALDSTTNDEIIRDILQIKESTCLIITHRCDEETLKLFDKVINLS